MNRPRLFGEMLQSLVACGLEGWHVFIALEPSPQQADFTEIAASLLPPESYTITVNPNRLGVRENPRQAITRAFRAGSELNLCLEEDFRLAPDALLMAKWYQENHKPHWMGLNLLAGLCGSAGNLSAPALPKVLFETRCFNSIGVAFTRSDWDRVSHCFRPRSWRFLRRRNLFDEGWDWALFAYLLLSEDLRMVQPLAARCTHTGTHGTHCTPDFQARAFDRLPLSDWTPDSATPPGYELTDIDALPYEISAHIYSQLTIARLQTKALRKQRVRIPAKP
ncbi:MAG: hypothetical protein OQK00_04275 [Rhodobacteraceae bacterium]|nr:hypothetical protein [Paracoccaceae bacterium]MCW9043623.1 hypothetical protein [Pseudopelagicola sp.]